MEYIEIFNEIVDITHNDYSGCIDKKGWDKPEVFRKKISELQANNKVNSYIFEEIVNDYLLDFQDGHMFFSIIEGENEKNYDNGFKCRRYRDKLYVTYVGKEERLKKGMAITSLDDIDIIELSKKHRKEFKQNTEEREKWEPIVAKYTKCIVEDLSGNVFELDLKKYEVEKYISEYSLKTIQNGIMLMTLNDFRNAEAINEIIEKNQEGLESIKNLIIDVRYNRGGSDSAYFKLLNYIFNKDITEKDLDDGYFCLFNMTERNYNIRTTELKKYLEILKDPMDINLVKVFLREMDKHKNEGFVELNLDDVIPDMIIHGKKNPQNIVVLSDFYCGSSGDAFVEIVKKSEKVTVMGRPTMGITDYSNLALQVFEDKFKFMYPTSRSSRIDVGKGLTGIGVIPHIYIPWTPEHIEKDVDMEKAIKYLLSK